MIADADKAKIDNYMRLTGLKQALIRMSGRFYFCSIKEELSAWENYPQDILTIVECPPPVEIIG